MTKSKPRVVTDEDYRLLADFRYALRGFFAFSKSAVAQAKLAPQQYQALLALRARCGREMTVGDLAQELYVQHHTAVGLIDRLEQSGLARRRHGDGRRIVLELTNEAEAVLADLAQVHLEELRRHAPTIASLLVRYPAAAVADEE